MRHWSKIAVLLAAGTCAGTIAMAATAKEAPVAVAQDPKAAEVIRELGLVEGGEVLREKKGWKPPKKIALFSMGPIEAVQAVAPGVELVVVKDRAELLAQAPTVDAILGGDNLVCDDAVLAAAKKVRWVAVYSAGNEACVDDTTKAIKAPLQSPSVTVTNMKAIAGPVMAEHSIALMFALARSLQVSVGRQARGDGWGNSFQGSEPQALEGKTLMVVGLGGIGIEVARRANVLGMKVIATRNSSRDKPDFVEYVGLSHELPELIAKADVVVSALPLVPATTNLFDAKMFARMKKNAFFINVGRGGSVVTDDLVAALNNGTIAGAGLDVTEPEPLPKEHALWKARNIIITPHMSARSDLGQNMRALILREQVRRFAAGDKLLSVVDPKRGY
jgi:phosphoglycerate dehydrogenase-like enzyme